MSNPIKIAIVGLGRAGRGMQCRELKERENQFQIAGACDPIDSRREEMERDYPGCRTYADIEELVNDPDIEVISIASRSSDHFAHGMLALQAGKHVFMEKPMAGSYEEAVQLFNAASASAGNLYVRHNRRFDPDFLHVREIVGSGLLGEVYSIKLNRHSYQRRDDWQTLKEFGGGQLLNWGPHVIDHGLQLLESPLQSIWGELKLIAAAGDAEDHLKIIMKGANGRTVDLEISGGTTIPSPTYLIQGTRGGLSSNGKEIRLKYLNPEQELAPRVANPGTPGEMFGTTGTYGSKEELDWVEETIPVQPSRRFNIWDELYKSIREGSEFPIRPEEAVEVMKVIYTARSEGDGFKSFYREF